MGFRPLLPFRAGKEDQDMATIQDHATLDMILIMPSSGKCGVGNG